MTTTRNAPSVPAGTRRRFGEGAVIVCDNLIKIHKVADLEVVALQGLDLVVESGELVAIVGASGSGKSTLLNILGGLDVPSAGRAIVAGRDLTRMSGRQRTDYRRSVVGFIWQQTSRNLFPYLGAQQNVELPMLLGGVGRRERHRRSAELLDLVGLADRATLRPEHLSGGEQQRVAVARSVVGPRTILLADEPTASLDSLNGEAVVELLRRRCDAGAAALMVTHDNSLAGFADRVAFLRDGRLADTAGPVAGPESLLATP